jgi:preprotein translocase subunit SecF
MISVKNRIIQYFGLLLTLRRHLLAKSSKSKNIGKDYLTSVLVGTAVLFLLFGVATSLQFSFILLGVGIGLAATIYLLGRLI